jgi:hypothetical protein
VQKTNKDMLRVVVDGMVKRICIGLPAACTYLADDAAQDMFIRLVKVHDAIKILRDYDSLWHDSLKKILERDTVNGLLRGYACNLLQHARTLSMDEVMRQIRLATTGDPAQTAAWLQGFLHRRADLLINDTTLLQVIDEWVMMLGDESFIETLPLVRRTFSQFEEPQRQRIGMAVKRMNQNEKPVPPPTVAENENTEAAISTINMLLGVDNEEDDA